MKKNDLEVIKEGKTGHGILIEHDGFVSLDKKQLKEGIEDGEWYVPNPFIVDAVFQKFGIKNANGRIYPEEILKREVEKYQSKIEERRAYGECYKPDALILTETGWTKLENVNEGDVVLTLNPETNEIEKKPIIKKIEYDFDGEMIHIHGRNIDDVVTPEHGYPIYDRNGKFRDFKTAKEIFESKSMPSFYIPKNIGFKDEDEFSKLVKGIYLDKRFLKVEKEQYTGKVMCVEVENHIWYVMNNGKCHWTKNCNHPADSTINLSRVSHNIVELHWENATLVGKLEINTSEGFRKNGIVTTCGDEVANLLLNGYKIGVSSRGVGSVEQKLGQYLVGDDFELICWDVVSDPSTPGAFISNERGDLAQYIENNQTQEDKNCINEKIQKIKSILES